MEIEVGADSHLFLKNLVGANERTDAIACPDESPSLSYSAKLCGDDADALLNTQSTVPGFPSVNYQEYLNVSLRLDSSFQHIFQRTLYDARVQNREFCPPLVYTRRFPLNRVLGYKNCKNRSVVANYAH